MISYELNTIDFLILIDAMRRIDGDHITNVDQIDEHVCMARIRPTRTDATSNIQWYNLEFNSASHRTLFNLKYGTNYA